MFELSARCRIAPIPHVPIVKLELGRDRAARSSDNPEAAQGSKHDPRTEQASAPLQACLAKGREADTGDTPGYTCICSMCECNELPGHVWENKAKLIINNFAPKPPLMHCARNSGYSQPYTR